MAIGRTFTYRRSNKYHVNDQKQRAHCSNMKNLKLTFPLIAWQIILVTVIFVPPIYTANATLIGDHICYRNER